MYEDIDQRIINVLLGNGRASLRQIAEETDVSVTTISNHLEQLEEEGILTGYSPNINYDGLGYDVTAVTQVRVSGDGFTDFTNDVHDHPQFITVYETTGDYDVHITGKFEDTDDMNIHIKELLNHPAVEDANTNVVLSTEKEHEQFELTVDE